MADLPYRKIFTRGEFHTEVSARVPLAIKEDAAEKSLQGRRRAAAYPSIYRIAPLDATVSACGRPRNRHKPGSKGWRTAP